MNQEQYNGEEDEEMPQTSSVFLGSNKQLKKG